ncbi:MAG: glycosyltransferase [Dehalococcoidia bacterium]
MHARAPRPQTAHITSSGEAAPVRVGYVLAAYPVLSETFILNELIEHEAAGLPLQIYSLGPELGGSVHDVFGRIRTAAQYLDAARDANRTVERMAAELVRRAAEQGVTHLHAHFADVAAEVTGVAASALGIPWSFTAHAVDIFHRDVDEERLARMARAAAFVVTVSEYNVADLQARIGEHVDLYLIRNGLDLERFEFRTDVDATAPIVGAGRLVEKKGFADLIDACRLLGAGGWSCTIVGDGPLRGALEAQAHMFGVDVSFTGALAHRELLRHMRGATVFVAPSVVASDGNRDGIPTVLVEAMALGVPVVSTAVTGIPELVRDGETGLLCQPRDPMALAAATARLLGDPELLRRVTTNARALVEREYDARRNTAQLRALFGRAARAVSNA